MLIETRCWGLISNAACTISSSHFHISLFYLHFPPQWMAMLGNSSFPEILQSSLIKPTGHQSWSTLPFTIERVVGDSQRLAGTRPATSLACLATLNQRLLCLAFTLLSVPMDSAIPYHWWNGSPWRRYRLYDAAIRGCTIQVNRRKKAPWRAEEPSTMGVVQMSESEKGGWGGLASR